MPNTGSNTVKTNARRVQKALGIEYPVAFRALTAAKADGITWTQTANNIIEQEKTK